MVLQAGTSAAVWEQGRAMCGQGDACSSPSCLAVSFPSCPGSLEMVAKAFLHPLQDLLA